MKDKLYNWYNTFIRIVTLFPFVGGVYVYAYAVFSEFYDTNIKGFSFGDVINSILVYMMCAIILMPDILIIIINFFTLIEEDHVRKMIPPYNYDKYRRIWDIFLLVAAFISFGLLVFYKKIKFVSSHLIYVLLAILLTNYLLFSSLSRHLEVYQDRCLSAYSNIKKRYTGTEKILLSLKNFYKIYLLVIIFIYPIPRFSEINTADNVSIWFIFIQIILITKFFSDEKNKNKEPIVDSKLIISSVLIPLFLAIVEKILKIK